MNMCVCVEGQLEWLLILITRVQRADVYYAV